MTDPASDTTLPAMPLAMLLGSAFGAVREAQDAGERFADHLAATDARTARGFLDHAMSHAAQGEDAKAEEAAAKALDVAISAIRRAEEIDVGLQQPLTDAQLYGRLCARADTSAMKKAERRDVEEWVAAWRAMEPWQAPKGEDLDERLTELDYRLNAILTGPATVTPRVSRWLTVRRVLGRLGLASTLRARVMQRQRQARVRRSRAGDASSPP